ncbi:VAMP-associated protein [Phellopilus nigrolimitatus]|nr:VAMP-associated protein [Phellopilus nigrolimitatus]
MSVSLKPSSSLAFNRPLTQLVKRVLTVTNNNEQPVAFKVKTTAPKLYCVRPNSGRIEPGGSVDVQVLLQAMKEEPPANAKCKDKFLVQSTIITAEKEAMPSHDLWNNEESEVHQQKVKVVYLPPVGQELPEEDENPSSFIDNSARFESTHRESTNGHAGFGFPPEQQAPLERAFSPAVGDYGDPEGRVEHVPVSMAVPPPVTVDVRPSPSITQKPLAPVDEELRAQLAAAQAEISRLRALLESVPEPSASAEEGIRRRGGVLSDTATARSDSGETDSGTYIESVSVQTEGVPPQIVFGISLAVFMLTYLFF